MFSKKPHADVKKSTQKVLDHKKDSATRLKHLRVVLDNVDISEAKIFFETNYSNIYYIFYDQFIIVEGNIRQKVHRAHREELDVVLYLFEKILILLPELLSKKWQCHSIGRLMKKLLHPKNALKLRREALRLFLIWYQILGEGAPQEIHDIFSCLVPGLHQNLSLESIIDGSNVKASDCGTVSPVELYHILPPQSGERQPESPVCYFLDVLTEYMVTQVTKIEWKDKGSLRQQRCFHFLFERFKRHYLDLIFVDFQWTYSLYKPVLDLPELRFEPKLDDSDKTSVANKDVLDLCKIIITRWIANFTHNLKKVEMPPQSHTTSVTTEESGSSQELKPAAVVSEQNIEKYSGNSSTYISANSFADKDSFQESEDHSQIENKIVRDTLYSNRENVNLVHEVFRQAFLLPFKHSHAIKRVIMVYKDWIINNTQELPAFMLEPYDGVFLPREENSNAGSTLSMDSAAVPEINCLVESPGLHREGAHWRGSRLRNDSYLGAIHRDHINVRAGLQNTLQLFITNAANVFLLETEDCNLSQLEEQVDLCKRVLNIYRYMVMNVCMEQKTWEQLLLVLLQITSLILKETPPVKKEETLGGRLAPALFQTLIVTWIRANLHVVISTELWDQLLQVLSSLTEWEELIREWAKTLETLTRVLARHVYGLDLNDLPLERLSEQKQKKRRGRLNPPEARQSFFRNWSRSGSEPPENPNCKEDISITGNMSTSVMLETKENIPEGQETTVPDNSYKANNTSTVFYTSDLESSFRSKRDRHRSNSGDNEGRQHIHSSTDRRISIHRSISEGNLTSKSHSPSRRSSRESPVHCKGVSHISGIYLVDQEVEQMVVNAEEFIKQEKDKNRISLRRRSKSLESLRFGRAPSTLSCASDSSMECHSRTPSPSPSSGLESNSIKDSPMQIDLIGADNSCGSELFDGSREEHRSVMSGGTTRGFLPDVAIALWRRMLGILDDVNEIKNPDMHAKVFESLIDLAETLVKIRENQSVTSDNQSTPPPPEFIPPVQLISPWLFKAVTLNNAYHKGQLYAFRLLCFLSVRRHDTNLTRDHILLFYRALHQGLVCTNQEVINTIVKFCGPRFFSLGLPGSTMLLLDFIYAADTIASSSELKGVPRTEAMSLLGCLIPFANLYLEMPVLQPNASEFTLMTCKDVKDHIINVLLKSGKREPAGLARCVAISSLGIYLYEELVHKTYHSKMKDALNVLLTALRQSAPGNATKSGLSNEFNNKIVGQVASDMLLLLCDHAPALLCHFPDVPRKIIEVIASTLSSLLTVADLQSSSEEKKLLISMMFCLGEWCMRIPQSLLILEEDGKSLIQIVFKVLNIVVSGKWNSNKMNLHIPGDLGSPDFDPNIQFDNTKEGSSSTPGSPKSQITTPTQELSSNYIVGSPVKKKENSLKFGDSSPLDESKEWNVVKLAARTIMSHLVNHLNHFPMGIGAARLTSMVNEHDDIPGLHTDELSTEVFHSPSVQFFVLNNSTLLSFVELPALDVPGGGVTAGLKTARYQVRVIMRDMGGKFSWDSSILYGPPNFPASFSFEDSMVWLSPLHQSLNMQKSDDSLPAVTQISVSSPPRHTLRHRLPDVLPTVEDTAEDMDNLDDLLQFIGHTSPECLDRPGQPLNVHAPTPFMLSSELEDDTINIVLSQRNYEQDYVLRHCNDINMLASPLKPTPTRDPDTPFHHCRLLLDQLGFMSWEKRPRFDLLKKSERLLRELRNLDNQKCRETHKIAVVYVAEGQEDKNSVLCNSGGSQAYEEFVAGLAWEVELETHTGFLGGLQRNKSTGDTAPYFATSFVEVIFHVATRMPTNNEESKLQKLRHLGNDEVHIVWSEHHRDYRREIIPTEFCDVLIVIYPLPNRLYRIQINRKAEVPYFGPLFNGAIVDHKILPGLVRATAINASRAKRSMLPFYQNFYEERAKALDTVVHNHKDSTTFEDFTANVYTPAQPKPFQQGPSRALGSSFPKTESSGQHLSSTLAAALIDSHTGSAGSPPLRNRPVSLSASEHTASRDQHSRSYDSSNVIRDENGQGSNSSSPKGKKQVFFSRSSHLNKSFGSHFVVSLPESPTSRNKK